MSALGDLLELLHGAEHPFETLRGHFRVWRRQSSPSRAAVADSGERVTHGGPRVAGDWAPQDISIWRARPDRVRLEWHDGERAGEYRIVDGEEWSGWVPGSGVTGSESSREPADEYGALCVPRMLLSSMLLEVVGRTERAGRAAIIANARQVGPRPILRSAHSDRYRLELDAERGIVLAWSSLVGAKELPEFEAVELAFDERLPDSLFRFAPPPGEAGDRELRLQRVWTMSVAEAQAAAPFTVLVPRDLPKGWRLKCTFVDGSQRPDIGPEVHLHYHSRAGRESVTIVENATRADGDADPDDANWQPAAAGEELVSVRGGDETLTEAQLLMARGDTRVFMNSLGLRREDLIMLARLLAPAPTAS